MIGLTLKRFQQETVDSLMKLTSKVAPETKAEQRITLQSPTGSGKTIILVSYIETYLDTQNADAVFVWLTPGAGELEEQSYNKLRKFAPNIQAGNLADVLQSGFQPGGAYFINWESVNKKKNKAIRDGERENLLDKIVKAHKAGLQIIVIVDEEHDQDTKKTKDIIAFLDPVYEIRVSATPKNKVTIKIDEQDVIDEELITKGLYINEGVTEAYLDSHVEGEEAILLSYADKKRKEVAEEYKAIGEDINPLVIIQFPNSSNELIERVENKLKSMGYTYENGLLASWFNAGETVDKLGKKKKLEKHNIGEEGTANSITNHNSKVCFLLCKQAIATGWDCPRAKVLVALRETSGETLKIQTLGRLRRMPKAHHYQNKVLDYAFVYTFDKNYRLDVLKDPYGYEVRKLYLKNGAKNIQLKKEQRDLDISYTDMKAVRKDLYNFFVEKYDLGKLRSDNKITLENHGFVFYGPRIVEERLGSQVVNTLDEMAEGNLKTVELQIEVDMRKHSLDMRKQVDRLKGAVGLDLSQTRSLLNTFFWDKSKVKGYNILSLPIREYYAFVLNNIRKLLDDFREFDSKGSNSFKFSAPQDTKKVINFVIPKEEYYEYSVDKAAEEIFTHNVYEGYTSYMTNIRPSQVERLFERYCQSSAKVKYFYKNGDKGSDYLSILYSTGAGKTRAFYPDYILQLDDGRICIVETKGGETADSQDKNIDDYAVIKFKALKAFANEHGYEFAFVRDKNQVLYFSNTKYVDDMQDSSWQGISKLF